MAYLGAAGAGRSLRGLAGQGAAERLTRDAGHKGRGSHSGLESRRATSLRRDNRRGDSGLGERGSACHATNAGNGRFSGFGGGNRAAGEDRSPGAGSDRSGGAALARASTSTSAGARSRTARSRARAGRSTAGAL